MRGNWHFGGVSTPELYDRFYQKTCGKEIVGAKKEARKKNKWDFFRIFFMGKTAKRARLRKWNFFINTRVRLNFEVYNFLSHRNNKNNHDGNHTACSSFHRTIIIIKTIISFLVPASCVMRSNWNFYIAWQRTKWAKILFFFFWFFFLMEI